MAKRIEPTPEDYEAVRRRMEEEDPREALIRELARHEAYARVAREREERRRTWLRRMSLGLLGR
jgi:chromatin segregation and condensation protein Rec8/ScpA/Scc1 (kleisin family)